MGFRDLVEQWRAEEAKADTDAPAVPATATAPKSYLGLVKKWQAEEAAAAPPAPEAAPVPAVKLPDTDYRTTTATTPPSPAQLVSTRQAAAKAEFKRGKAEDYAAGVAAGFPQGVSQWSDEGEGIERGLGNYIGDKVAASVHGLQPGPPLAEEYRKARDERRAANVNAATLSPSGYGAGMGLGVGTSLALPGSQITSVPGMAAQGAIIGLGASDADLTKGEYLPAAKDAAGGALVAANTALVPGLVGGLVTKATNRELDRNVDKLLEGVPKAKADKALDRLKRTTGEHIDPRVAATLDDDQLRSMALSDIVQGAGGREAIKKTVRSEGLNLGENAQVLPVLVSARKQKVGREIGDTYERVGANTPGVPLGDVTARLERLEKKSGKGTPEANAIASIREDLLETFDDHIPLTDLWKLQRSYAEKGYSMEGKYFFNPVSRARIGRDVAGEMKSALQGEIKRVTERRSDLGSLDELQEANRRFGALSALEQLAQAKALKAGKPTKPSPMGRIANVVELTAPLAPAGVGAYIGSQMGQTGLGAAAGSAYGGFLAARGGVRALDSVAGRVGSAIERSPVAAATMEGVGNVARTVAPPFAATGAMNVAVDAQRRTREYQQNVVQPIRDMATNGADERTVTRWALERGVNPTMAHTIFAQARRTPAP